MVRRSATSRHHSPLTGVPTAYAASVRQGKGVLLFRHGKGVLFFFFFATEVVFSVHSRISCLFLFI